MKRRAGAAVLLVLVGLAWLARPAPAAEAAAAGGMAAGGKVLMD